MKPDLRADYKIRLYTGPKTLFFEVSSFHYSHHFPRVTLAQSWLNVERLHIDPAQPVSDRLSCKLGTIVRPDVLRGSSLREKLRQHGQNVVVPEPSLHMDRQALPPVLVNDCQHAEGSAVVGPICDEVVRPHMPFMLRSQPHTGTIIEL